MSAARDFFGIVTILVKARLKNGLTLEVVAARVGVTPQAVHQWESRRVIPKADHLAAWCRALGMRLAPVPLDEVA